MRKKALHTAFLCLMALLAGAQGMEPGRVTVKQSPQVDSLLALYSDLHTSLMKNPDHKGIPGYRIQIFFDSGSNSSDRAKSASEDFSKKYENIPSYITWKAPNYRVRVGDFRSRLEAEKALQSIIKDYPNAWVIKDEINFPNLNQQ